VNNPQPPQPAPQSGPTAPTPVSPKPDVPTPDPVAPVVPMEPVPVAVEPLPVLTLTTTTSKPVVGREIVVVPALEPARAGASYRVDWGDGSAVETVSASGMHHYAKAQLYKVSASTVVGRSKLNHEMLLQVEPVPGRQFKLVVGLLAALTGAGFWGTHLIVPKLSASFRWGAPSVPEMKLLSREPYLSLSFEPGVGLAEEDITFSKKRRKSGLEQG
jgi:hypothetical protein